MHQNVDVGDLKHFSRDNICPAVVVGAYRASPSSRKDGIILHGGHRGWPYLRKEAGVLQRSDS